MYNGVAGILEKASSRYLFGEIEREQEFRRLEKRIVA